MKKDYYSSSPCHPALDAGSMCMDSCFRRNDRNSGNGGDDREGVRDDREGVRDDREGVRDDREGVRDDNVKLGFTLIELMVVIGIITMVIGSGMGIFYRSLRSGSKIDLEIFLDGSSRSVENSMSSLIGFSEVTKVAGSSVTCLSPGSVSGSSLTIKFNGLESLYSLSDDFIASASAGISKRVSPEGMVVSGLAFVWTCQPGYPDRVAVSYTATAKKDDQLTPVSKNYAFSVVVKNSNY